MCCCLSSRVSMAANSLVCQYSRPPSTATRRRTGAPTSTSGRTTSSSTSSSTPFLTRTSSRWYVPSIATCNQPSFLLLLLLPNDERVAGVRPQLPHVIAHVRRLSLSGGRRESNVISGLYACILLSHFGQGNDRGVEGIKKYLHCVNACLGVTRVSGAGRFIYTSYPPLLRSKKEKRKIEDEDKINKISLFTSLAYLQIPYKTSYG